MTTILLIRHAAHDWLGRGLPGRLAGVHLNAQGAAEADELAWQLGPLPIEAVYTSPMERAQETAAPIARVLRCPLIHHADLTEIDFGNWTGRTFPELQGEPEWARWNEERARAGTPGGELMRDAAMRVMRALGQLASAHPAGTIVAVSHGDLIRAAILNCRGASLNDIHELTVTPASVTALQWEGNGAHVLFVGCPGDRVRSFLNGRAGVLNSIPA